MYAKKFKKVRHTVCLNRRIKSEKITLECVTGKDHRVSTAIGYMSGTIFRRFNTDRNLSTLLSLMLTDFRKI